MGQGCSVFGSHVASAPPPIKESTSPTTANTNSISSVSRLGAQRVGGSGGGEFCVSPTTVSNTPLLTSDGSIDVRNGKAVGEDIVVVPPPPPQAGVVSNEEETDAVVSPVNKDTAVNRTTTPQRPPQQRKAVNSAAFTSTLAPANSFAVKIYDRRKDKEQRGDYDKAEEEDAYQRMVDAAGGGGGQTQNNNKNSRSPLEGKQQQQRAEVSPLPLVAENVAHPMPVPPSTGLNPFSIPATEDNRRYSLVPVTRQHDADIDGSLISGSMYSSMIEEGGEYTTCALSHYPEPSAQTLPSSSQPRRSSTTPPPPSRSPHQLSGATSDDVYDDFVDDMADSDMKDALGGALRGRGAGNGQRTKTGQQPRSKGHKVIASHQ